MFRNKVSTPPGAPTHDHVDQFEQEFQRLKADIHQILVEQLDLSRLTQWNQSQLRREVRHLAETVCKNRTDLLAQPDRERLLDELLDEVFGLGPLEKLVQDPTISDILVNDHRTVYVERRGKLILTDVVFADDAHLMRIIQRVVSRVGRRIDESSPMVDARLPDGSRVNAVIAPLALDGPSMSIRKFGARPLAIGDLLGFESITEQMVQFLTAAIEARVSILISGGTGSGKTTLLNTLSAFIPAEERLVTVEDSAELILQHRHRIRLETRPANIEGAGAITQRDLVRNALRMRPDRIIVGEVRGAEVWDMLQAMNTGHEGSLTTVHANSAADALARLEMMVAMTGFDLPIHVIRQHMVSAIPLIVHLARLKGGVRKVLQVAEIVGLEQGDFVVRNIFGFQQTDVDAEGLASGRFFTTGYQPRCLSRIRASGLKLPQSLFERSAGAPSESQSTDDLQV